MWSAAPYCITLFVPTAVPTQEWWRLWKGSALGENGDYRDVMSVDKNSHGNFDEWIQWMNMMVCKWCFLSNMLMLGIYVLYKIYKKANIWWDKASSKMELKKYSNKLAVIVVTQTFTPLKRQGEPRFHRDSGSPILYVGYLGDVLITSLKTGACNAGAFRLPDPRFL